MNVLEFAIKMELDGEKYYNDQAKITTDSSLKTVFLILAKDENSHAKILQKRSNKLSYELENNETLSETKNLFKGIKDFKSDIKQLPNQLDLYRVALEKEKESITLYEKLLLESEDDESKEFFSYLLKQEKEHYEILDELVLQLNKSNDWVESAEFGITSED
ncbi:ferritin-like domain-containing protein [Clostridium vincentii]|uniref:Putative trifunctional 2-polyprenylphenol hydroxylase/glutamate synthase subunit beta/ferritin domain-containing protein n=1 Tax=Clostridium vincentii TaxID=52704 RepID=A0A2T0BCR7_9CLOT|nr:ferritin family protein [Clostridium vincentii]PRR81696.1 putative trifunctional 2-polyprenylphenol hydroxylase/glutamate synthase subunit beta/ferritin domain-containing protein [Clostridium vincentii]